MDRWLRVLVCVLAVPFACGLSLSEDGGFYPNAMVVVVNVSGLPGNVVWYTVDGSNPLVNGSVVNGSITLEQRASAPSGFAVNAETSLYPFTSPTSTLKASILRVVEVDPLTNRSVANLTRTYFLGLDRANFTLPVFSVVLDDAYLQGYEGGMFVKGRTYYDDLAARGGNPTDPFRPANWNNDSDRWPAHMELYRDGVRFLADAVVAYPSGRWSAALAKKSVKLKYDKAVGPQSTSVLLFGNESPSSMNKVWLKQGGQDFDGLGLRDCIAAEAITDAHLRVEETQCSEAVLFLNGEFYGVMNINQDLDAKYYANRYPLSKDDVVVLEQDGLVDEGKAVDNAGYFTLKTWLLNASTNLSENASYAYFASQVNPDGLIDHMIVQIYFNNDDYPNDFRIWRDKNNASQVNGTMYDGRWQFQPKDLDQTVGLYAQINVSENTLLKFLNRSGYGYVMFTKAMENPEFRARFVNRTLELVNGPLDSAHINATVDRLAQDRRPEVPKDIQRWQKPTSWESKLVAYKDWMARRQGIVTSQVMAFGGLNASVPNTTDPRDVLIAQLQANITQLQSVIAALQGNLSACLLNQTVGNATNTTNATAGNVTLAISSVPNATVSVNGTPLGVTPQVVSLAPGTYTIAAAAIGYVTNTSLLTLVGNASLAFTLVAIPPPNTTNSTVGVALQYAAWYPKKLNAVLVCNATGFTPASYDFVYGDGHKTLGYTQNNVYHTYPATGTYQANCTARNATTTGSGYLTVSVTA